MATTDTTVERERRVTADQEAMEAARTVVNEAGLDGGEPVPLSEFEERADEAARRVRGEQLTFELGVGRKDAPDFATVTIAGALTIERDLRYGEPVTVTLVDRFGEIVGEAPATVGYPGFKDHFDKHGGKTVERLHVATLE